MVHKVKTCSPEIIDRHCLLNYCPISGLVLRQATLFGERGKIE